jgi:crotonobetainyl-CoA:carnitine CoA-transferase CaiB-like acyl-CoA transferase
MTDRAGALDGYRVVDFSHQGAGPWAATLLGDMGAEVWKIEKPGRGDGVRYTGDADWRIGSYNFWGFNRNKKSVGIDLQTDGGRELALEMVDSADVVIENFRPGVMDRLGLGYEALSARNPRIVYGAISAFGQSGPMRDEPGMDLILQATSGLMGLTGEPDGPPVKTAAPVADIVSGVYLAYGIALALLHRERGGTGQRIDVPMLDATMSLLSVLNTEFLNTHICCPTAHTRPAMATWSSRASPMASTTAS